MKVAVLRGNTLNPYEMQFYEELKKFGFEPIGICSKDNLFDTSSIGFPIRKLTRIGQINIPILRQALHYFFCSDNWLLGFDKATEDCKLIHTVEHFNPYSYQAIKTGKPVIVTFWQNIPFVVERNMYKFYKKEVMKKAKHFIAITERAKKVLMLEGVEESRISVIPAGLDVSRFKSMPKDKKLLKRFGIPEKGKVILFVGRLSYQKGISNLMASMKRISEIDSNVYLLIVGGETKKRVDQAKELIDRLNLKDKIKIVGHVNYNDIPKVHNLAEMFVLPSNVTELWQEQFGYVLAEAMACEKPVISTYSGSIPEVVIHNKTGLLVQPGDVLSLEESILKLLKDEKLRKRLGKEGRKYVLKNYDKKIVAEKIAKIYRRYI